MPADREKESIQMTDVAPDDRETRDPARFSRREPDANPGGGERIGAFLALAGLVVVVPVVLALLGGTRPIPSSWPDRESLTQPISLEGILAVLLAVVWIAWAFFVVCVVVEVVAARRGGLARPVPLGGPVQKFARVLVGAALLTGIVAPGASAVPMPEVAAPTATASTSQADITDQRADQAGGVDLVGHSSQASEAAAPDQRRAKHEITAQEHLVGHKVYTVKTPDGGYHDNLWDIAERHLGDGRRYHEIFQLNKGLVQDDGRKLELARLIQPGWNLVMPDDAVGVATMPAPPVDPVGTAAASGGAGAASTSGSTGDLAATEADDLGGALGAGGGLGLLAAGALAALAIERRRRIGVRAAGDVEAQLRGFATADRAAFLDRALRELAAACREARAGLPAAYAVELTDEQVTLRLAPSAPDAVGEWTAVDDGSAWTRAWFEPDAELADERAPYPGLVSLGLDPQGVDVLVDLEAAGGVIAIDGDPTVAAEVAAAIAIQAGTAPWSEGVEVTATGLPEGLASIGGERIEVVADLGDAVTGCEASLDHYRVDVLTGRVGRRGATPTRLLVAGGHVPDNLRERLWGLAGAERQALSVVLTGPQEPARWTLHVDESGTLRLPELDVAVEANRIRDAQVAGLAELFTAARQPDRPDDGGRVAIPRPVELVEMAAWSVSPRRVGVLGPLAITGAGEIDPRRIDQATELVTYLAMHREGVHPNVLTGILWPRGVTPDVAAAAVERARAWLGEDVHGNPYLGEDGEGRLRLVDEVATDWDAARTAFIQARSAPRAAEIGHLRAGLQLVRGIPFAGLPDGRYGWLAHDDLERTMRRVVVDAAHRLAELCSGDGDEPGAMAAAEAGLRLDPAHQLLWRDLLRARYAAGGVAGVRQTLDTMGEPLRGIPLEPETEALVEEYLGASGSMTAS